MNSNRTDIRTIAVAIAGAMAAAGLLAAECKDGTCPIPAVDEAMVTVVSPVPESAVEPIRPAARLQSLDGKTIALVGGSFMANVTHPELKRLILAEYPTAKIYMLSEIGSAGPYPRPGVVRREKDEFQRKLKEFKIDAVISGNGGCGLCTPKETGSCIAAEVLGIPSVMIAAPGFVKQARSAACSAGLPELRVAEYPGAFASHTREELLANTRKVLWPQVKAGLMGGKDIQQATTESQESKAESQLSGSFSEIQRIFLDSGWTDGLPIVPPTEKAVAEFLRFTDLPPDNSLGTIPPAQRGVTVRHVAANYWGNPGSAFDPARYPVQYHERRIARKEDSASTATPPWLAWTGEQTMETVPAMAPGKSAFVVTGDPSRNKSLCVPGGGFTTIKIALPKAWDALMAERGYKPLSDFRLATDLKPDIWNRRRFR